MIEQQSPFQRGWYGNDLGAYRPCPSTYCFYPYESLPPLPMEEFRGEFRWLLTPAASDDAAAEEPEAPTSTMTLLVQIEYPAGLRLPDDFLRFFGLPPSHPLRRRVRSRTDCIIDLSEWIIPSPGADGGYLIQFLADSQDGPFWYLYLKKIRRKWENCVVASGTSFNPYSTEDVDEADDLVYCAPGFEPFLYRFWIENEISFALHEGSPLSERQRAYVRHYGAGSASDGVVEG